MAGPYYVDIDAPASWVGRTGLDKTDNAWLGLSGLQYAVDTVTVGNGPIYVKGSTAGLVKRLKTIASTTNLVGVFQRGEQVTWDATASNGIVSEIAANAPTVIEVVTGTLANPDSLVGVTSGATCDINGAVAQKATGIDIDTNSGAYNSGFIKIIGCKDDADYTVSGGTDRAIISMTDATDAVATGINGATVDFIWLENIRCTEAGTAKSGVYTASGADSWVFLNCCMDNNANYGFYISGLYSLLVKCVSYQNTVYGYGIGSYTSKLLFCCARDNTSYGFYGAASLVQIGCVAHNNTRGCSNTSEGSLIMNTVIDSNTLYGIFATATTSPRLCTVIGNRITNTGGGVGTNIGLDCQSAVVVGGWNYFEDNEDNIANDTYYIVIPTGASYVPGTTTETPSDAADQADTNEGYNAAVGSHDFATGYVDGTDPTLRRTAITIPWS